MVFGGDGNDLLKAGGGNSVLLGKGGDDLMLGGSGNDELNGGQGRDFLIGGTGADRLNGGPGGDILIAGFTAYDQNFSALTSLHDVWRDPELTDSQRMASIQNASLRNGVYLGSETVGDDNSADRLTGASGLDWFWFDPLLDRATDAKNEPTMTDHNLPSP